MSDDRFALTMLLVPVVALYALFVEWTATHWFGQSKGMSGPAMVGLVAVWVWLAHRRIERANGTTTRLPVATGRAFARTAAPALILATALLLPQLLLYRWWAVILAIAGIGLVIRLWRRRQPGTPGPDPRPNDP